MLSMNVALCVQLKQRRFLCSDVRERPFDFYWGWWIMLSGLGLIFTRRAIMSFYLHMKQCLHSTDFTCPRYLVRPNLSWVVFSTYIPAPPPPTQPSPMNQMVALLVHSGWSVYFGKTGFSHDAALLLKCLAAI